MKAPLAVLPALTIWPFDESRVSVRNDIRRIKEARKTHADG